MICCHCAIGVQGIDGWSIAIFLRSKKMSIDYWLGFMTTSCANTEHHKIMALLLYCCCYSLTYFELFQRKYPIPHWIQVQIKINDFLTIFFIMVIFFPFNLFVHLHAPNIIVFVPLDSMFILEWYDLERYMLAHIQHNACDSVRAHLFVWYCMTVIDDWKSSY